MGAAEVNALSGTITFFCSGIIATAVGTPIGYLAAGFTNTGIKGMNDTTIVYSLA